MKRRATWKKAGVRWLCIGMGWLAVGATVSVAAETAAPRVEYIGSDLKTYENSSRLAFYFSRVFAYQLEISDDKKTVRLLWPDADVRIADGTTFKADERIESARLAPGTDRRRPWAGVEIKAKTVFESVNDFWLQDHATLVIDVATANPQAQDPNLAREAQRRLQPLPMPELSPRGKTSQIGNALAGQLAVDASKSKASSLEEREKELEDFLIRLPETYAATDAKLSSLTMDRAWADAAAEMAARIEKDPNAGESLLWFFLFAEFKYRGMYEGQEDPRDALAAFQRFANSAPEGDGLLPYAYYRMAQIYHRLGLLPEESAHIALARTGKETPFDDLLMARQAQALADMKRGGEAKALLLQAIERYPKSPTRAEAEFQLGKIAWEEGTGRSLAESYNRFRAMIDLTTSPLANSTSRTLIVAQSLVYANHSDEAMPFLNSIITERSAAPTPEEGEAYLLLAKCLKEEGRTMDAIHYYEKAEDEGLPLRTRLAAALNLAELGFNNSRLPQHTPQSQSKSYLDCLATAQRVYEQAPDAALAVPAGYLGGRILAEEGRWAGAVGVYTKTCHDYPQSPLTANFKQLIVTYFTDAVAQAYSEGKYKEVVHIFSGNAELASQLSLDRPTRDRHAEALMKLGYYEEATEIWLRLYNERLPDDSAEPLPGPATLMLNLADGFEKTGKAKEALALLDERSVQYPEANEGRETLVRARIYTALGENARAIQALEQVVEDKAIGEDERLAAYSMLSKNYQGLGQWGNSELVMQKALAKLGASSPAFSDSEGARQLMASLGDLYFTRDQHKSALEVYRKYVELYPKAPDYAMALYRLGQLNRRLGASKEAEAIFKRIVKDMKEDALYRELAKTSLQEMAFDGSMSAAKQK